MADSFDSVIEGGRAFLTQKGRAALTSSPVDIGIKNGLIAEIGDLKSRPRAKTISGKHLTILPGLIDTQVHFREPGNTHKEDLASGTLSAIFGGVTSVFEMPNTKPPTLTAIEINDKLTRANGRAWCNYAFYVGASATNATRLADLEKLPGVCGVKMFMGSSTGDLFVGTDEVVREVVKHGQRRMAVHCEDEARLIERKEIVAKNPGDVKLHPVWRDAESALLATTKLLTFAREFKRKVHVLHVTTKEEMALLRKNKDIATVEVTPQHLMLSAPECYERLGTFAQMNPPIRDKSHTDALWAALNDGIVDVIGSDHAPHLISEKEKTYPDTPSGMPGVQTIAALGLNWVNQGRLTLERFVELTSSNAAKIFGIRGGKGVIEVGASADLVLVDMDAEREITNDWIQSKCKWTPFDGLKVKGWVNATVLGGEVVFRDNEVIGKPRGKALEFS